MDMSQVVFSLIKFNKCLCQPINKSIQTGLGPLGAYSVKLRFFFNSVTCLSPVDFVKPMETSLIYIIISMGLPEDISNAQECF
jgi:hypothetical protein